MELQSATTLAPPLKSWHQKGREAVSGAAGLFLLVVVVPTIIALVYFGLIASDIYTSESRFVVRSADRQTVNPFGALLKGTAFSRSQEDAYTVHEFMRSRDAMEQISVQLPLAKAFGSARIDIFSRFDPFGMDGSREALYRYYQGRLSIDVDSSSSISALRVSAFSAEDAYRINATLLEAGERLINALNERERQDMVRSATDEVATAEAKVKSAALALAQFRNEKALFDPERQSALQLQLVSKLQDELIAAEAQVAQVRRLTPNNPQLAALLERASTLRTEIAKQTGRVSGGDKSLTRDSAEFQRLSIELGFAEKQMGVALTTLEQARNEALRKQLYLERIVQPNKPDVAQEPRRLRAILATLVLGLVAWGVLSLLLAGVREHRA